MRKISKKFIAISFLEFTKWNGGLKDIGCSQSEGCSSSDGIVADAFYNPTEDIASFSWIAKDKFLENPYICMSKCPRYYTWFPSKNCSKKLHFDHTFHCRCWKMLENKEPTN